LQKLEVDSPQELIAKVYSPDMTRERLAALATVVFCHRITDEVAGSIVEGAAGALAELVATTAARLRLPPRGYSLAMAGGALLHEVEYLADVLDAVLRKLRRQGTQPARWEIVKEPVCGAVALARLAALGI
jgi:N-acetylglucosamine kinase-like BadF-type ATPase